MIRAELTEPLDVKRPGIRAGEMQRDTSRAFASPGGVAPFAGAVRRSSFFGFAALNPFYGGAIAHEAEGDSVAYSASSGA